MSWNFYCDLRLWERTNCETIRSIYFWGGKCIAVFLRSLIFHIATHGSETWSLWVRKFKRNSMLLNWGATVRLWKFLRPLQEKNLFLITLFPKIQWGMHFFCNFPTKISKQTLFAWLISALFKEKSVYLDLWHCFSKKLIVILVEWGV